MFGSKSKWLEQNGIFATGFRALEPRNGNGYKHLRRLGDLVDQNIISSNPLIGWLRQIQALRGTV